MHEWGKISCHHQDISQHYVKGTKVDVKCHRKLCESEKWMGKKKKVKIVNRAESLRLREKFIFSCGCFFFREVLVGRI